jgi:general secretion pathway protein G
MIEGLKKKQEVQKPKFLGSDGFTLTEMLIVVAIIAMIGTFAVGKISAQFNKAKVDSTKILIRNLATTLDNYRLDCNVYPTTEQGLEALVSKPTTGRDCKNYNVEGYMKKVPNDSWDTEFKYESDGQKFLIISLGQDKAEGGEANAADITSDSI